MALVEIHEDKAKEKIGKKSSWPDIPIPPSCILRTGDRLLLRPIYNLKWVTLLRGKDLRTMERRGNGLSRGCYVPCRRKRRSDGISLILIRLNRHIYIANVRPPIDRIKSRGNLMLTLIIICRITVPRRSVTRVCLRRT